MEKSIHSPDLLRRILITGPESTGKSRLAASLAMKYGGEVIPEYAREYVEKLGKAYDYRDVEHIALQQEQTYKSTASAQGWIFFDTWLFITRVWFEVVFQKIPSWIDDCMMQAQFDLILLCDTDLPWISDPVRENGGEKRTELLNKYKDEIEKRGMKWALVTGTGSERTECAIRLINNHILNGTT